jgi:hypothetical protein
MIFAYGASSLTVHLQKGSIGSELWTSLKTAGSRGVSSCSRTFDQRRVVALQANSSPPRPFRGIVPTGGERLPASPPTSPRRGAGMKEPGEAAWRWCPQGPGRRKFGCHRSSREGLSFHECVSRPSVGGEANHEKGRSLTRQRLDSIPRQSGALDSTPTSAPLQSSCHGGRHESSAAGRVGLGTSLGGLSGRGIQPAVNRPPKPYDKHKQQHGRRYDNYLQRRGRVACW